MIDTELLREVAEKAAKIADDLNLNCDLRPEMIMFRDPDAPKEALGLPWHESIEALFKKNGIEYTRLTREDITSLRISKLTLHYLEKVKEHPREPMESVLQRMLDFWDSHSNCEEMNKPMADDMKVLLKGALEKKFEVKCTGVLDLEEGTEFRFQGDPEGTPVLIPKR